MLVYKRSNMNIIACYITILLVFIVRESTALSASHNHCEKSTCSSQRQSMDCSCPDGVNCVIRAFEIYSIVPDVIPRAPPQMLSIQYPSDKVNLGNFIFPFKVTFPPYISWEYDHRLLYTIIYFIPDINAVRFGTYDHVILCGMRVNIPGHDILAGDPLAPYVTYLPITGGGSNRNVYLLYEQRKRINVTEEMKISVSTNITWFNLHEFVSTHDLGDPIFGNFFRTILNFCD